MLPRFLQRFLPKESWAAGEGGVIQQLVSYLTEGSALPGPLDFTRLSEEGFRRNTIVHACVRRISRSVAEAPLKAVTRLPNGDLRSDSPQPNDDLAQLLDHPNEEQDQYELFEQLLIHLHVAGNAFIYKVRSASGQVVALEMIRPDLVGVVPGKDRTEGKIKNYTVRVGDGEKRVAIAKQDIIHIKLPDALDEYWGLSPIYTLARYGDIDQQQADFLRAYFLNRGIPSGLLTFDKPVVKTERERVKELWKEQFQGLQGWHNVAVVDANVSYSPLATGVEHMDMSTVTAQTETRICMVYGVPPALIGGHFGLSQAKYGALDGFEKIFWTDTLSPMFARLSRKLTRDLVQTEFDKNRQAIFDLSQVSALQENRSEIRKVALQGFNFGLLTRNQSLKLLGLPQEEVNGDVVKVVPGSILIPIGDAKAFEPIEPTSTGTEDPTSTTTTPTANP